jgi:20S proteasome subunit beta 3
MGPYFVTPVVAGLDYDAAKKEYKPILSGYDLIGCMDENNTFAVGGTCTELLYGACESFYKEGMNPDELFEVISQSLLTAMDRDILSGWGAMVYILTPTQLITKKLLTRVD